MLFFQHYEQHQIYEKLHECWTSYSNVTKVAEKQYDRSLAMTSTSNAHTEATEKLGAILEQSTILQDDIGFANKHKKSKSQIPLQFALIYLVAECMKVSQIGEP